MRFTTYQPSWAPIRQMQREIDRVWDQYQDTRSDTTESTWAPVVDISEDGSRWLLVAELPGVSSENIDITAENGYLVIQGEKLALENNDADDDKEQDTKRRQERVLGRFYRRFSLPKEADTLEITATSKDGLLSVSIPKQPEVQPKRIQIKSA